MRAVMVGLILVFLPGLAFAKCSCSCLNGQAIAVCPPGTIVQPLCQRVCPDLVNQTLAIPSVAPPNLAGGISAGPGTPPPMDALGAGNIQDVLNQLNQTGQLNQLSPPPQ